MAPLTFSNNELNGRQFNYKSRMAGDVFAQSNSGGKLESYRNSGFGASFSGMPSKSNSNGAVSSAAAIEKPPTNKSSAAVKSAPTNAEGDRWTETYNKNLNIINNYKKIENDSNVKGTNLEKANQIRGNIMSDINYSQAVRKNEKIDGYREKSASIAAGNDHGSGDWKAPKQKEYYDYLQTYDGPKSYAAAVKDKDNGGYTKWDNWVKDSRNYKKAWEGIDYKKVNDRDVYGLP